jgi:hypothetical protein
VADSQRKKNEDRLLIALACGATVDTAAKFQTRLQAIRAEMVQRAAGMLTAAASGAVRTLLSLQKESVAAAVRLGAARAILEIGIKLREMVDLETQLTALEARLGQEG